MDKKFLNFDISFEKVDCFETEDILVPVKIRLLHDGLNRNSSFMPLNVIENASRSIINKPILAYIKRDEDYNAEDFAGHEMDLVLGDGESKTIYKERVVGIIPESTVIGYETIEDKTYMTCTAYLYKEYSNETISLIQATNGKCVSVEICVNDYTLDDNCVCVVNDFTFHGVTILGDDYVPGMNENCTITLFELANQNDSIVEARKKFIEKLDNTVIQLEETNNLETEKDDIEVESSIEEGGTNGVDNSDDKNGNVDFSIFNDLFDKEPSTLLEVKELFLNKIQILNNKLDELERFQSDILDKMKEQEIEEFNNSLDLGDIDVDDVLNKVKNNEIDIDTYKKEVYALIGEKNAKRKSSNTSEPMNFSLFSSDGDSVEKPQLYGGLLDKILGY